MNRLIMLIAAIVLFAAPAAFAETNGQEQAASDIVRTSSTQAVMAVTSRIASIAGAGSKGGQVNQVAKLDANGNFKFNTNAKEIGLASGDVAANLGIWGMGTYINFQNTASGSRYDANYYSAFAGIDWRATPDLLIGVAGGYGSLDLDKEGWNNGTDNGSLKTDYEWTIMPYAAYKFTDSTVLDAAFGYTDSRYKDSDGTDTSHYDATRLLSSIGLSQSYNIDAWTLSGRVGYMYVNGDLSTYSRGGTEIDNPDSYLGQVSAEAKASYLYDFGLEPYAALRYLYDVQTSTIPVGSDYDEFEGILGTNWYLDDAMTLGLEGGASMGRTDYEAYRGQLFIRYEF
ncbi:Autotransporter beta- domain protein [Pseudodesulfovibrio mercurii]|uniref:Autotransporter beta-domain protein n=1 Tax=Pseudodesulfovibrio mercurii TaxID=641491 RepID=F0JDY9_9BACT|nr:autotransporter outer membrane beta-barrel domain-containing protein [Pseudodesulfovibrio mercurii]EGB13429.1 Autotransporter beta- domain protein [Pseudodesulfovibrio mercurii]